MDLDLNEAIKEDIKEDAKLQEAADWTNTWIMSAMILLNVWS